jgi:hypothetical protein
MVPLISPDIVSLVMVSYPVTMAVKKIDDEVFVKGKVYRDEVTFPTVEELTCEVL